MIVRARLEELAGRFESQKLLVVGDLILDRYVSGTVSRISPEAPVPVVHVTGERCCPGGAANVARNIRSLGGQASVCGVIGGDTAGDELLGVLGEAGVSTAGVVRSDAVGTSVKTRVLADRQQIVRVDREDFSTVAGADIADLCARLRGLLADADGVVVEDYGKGSVTQQTCDAIAAGALERGIPVGLDPKDNHDLRFERLALATPNYREARLAAGLREESPDELPGREAVLRETVRRLRKLWNCDTLFVTLGPGGMCVTTAAADDEITIIPARAREVFDVSGAGDTVIAAAMLSLAAGAGPLEAAALANLAAGVVVGKVGTATCSRDELLACEL